MRRFLIGALAQFKRAQRLSMKLRGLTPEGVAERRVVTDPRLLTRLEVLVEPRVAVGATRRGERR